MNDGPIVEVLGADEAEVRQRRAAGALAAAGLEPGDRVAFVLPSSAALLCAVLGALRTGMVPVLLNATLVPTERELLLADARPSLSIVDDGALAALDRGTPVDLSPYPLARPMHYTSGTTGRAKGVWTGIWDQPTAAAAFRDEADLWDFGPGDVHLVCSPMYHSVSIRFAAGTLMSGGTCVVLSRFDAAAALAALSGKAGVLPTTTFMAPAALHRLLSLGSALPARFDSLRLLVHAGSPCPPVVKRAAMERVRPDVLWEFYGSTEGQFTACSSAEWTERPGTVGRARVGRRLTVDDDGTVWCHPPSFARFLYWDDEAKTAAAWRDGSFTVGDIGRLDSDGYLFLDGRRDDLIISGGERLSRGGGGSPGRGSRGIGNRRVRAARRDLGRAGVCRSSARSCRQWSCGRWCCRRWCCRRWCRTRWCRRRRRLRCGPPPGSRRGPPGPVQAAEGVRRHPFPAPHGHGQAAATAGSRCARVRRRPMSTR
ncbi:MAG TPA: AMP-binding protein [Acidimicrobiales bacterium]|nr:AMP-binding protein [Acidimicrobiales bacterium]